MTSYAKQISYQNYPESQRLPCKSSDMYRFVRERLGGNIVTSSGTQYGRYLYRNTRNNVLMASWEKPCNKQLYSSCDIGMNADALQYYKNE